MDFAKNQIKKNFEEKLIGTFLIELSFGRVDKLTFVKSDLSLFQFLGMTSQFQGF